MPFKFNPCRPCCTSPVLSIGNDGATIAVRWFGSANVVSLLTPTSAQLSAIINDYDFLVASFDSLENMTAGAIAVIKTWIENGGRAVFAQIGLSVFSDNPILTSIGTTIQFVTSAPPSVTTTTTCEGVTVPLSYPVNTGVSTMHIQAIGTSFHSRVTGGTIVMTTVAGANIYAIEQLTSGWILVLNSNTLSNTPLCDPTNPFLTNFRNVASPL